jgi:hypothetical protein
MPEPAEAQMPQPVAVCAPEPQTNGDGGGLADE